jgi:integrase
MLCFAVIYGQGRVFRRDNIWWVAYFDGQGHEQRESSRSPDKAVALQLLRVRLANPAQPATDHTFEDIAALYLEEHGFRGARSRDWADDRVNHLRKVFAGVRIVRITAGDMQRYRSLRLKEGAAAGTVNRDLGALGRMLTLAQQQGWIQQKPRLQRLQEADPRQGFVEHPQYLGIRQHLPADYQDALDFGYYSGWRKGEITGLTWAMIDFQSGTIRLPPSSNKSRQGRVLVLSEPLRDVIQRRLQLRTDEQPLVFHTRGRAIRDWRKAWRTATVAAGCPGVLFHDIRRTVVRNLIRAGVPERMAMAVTRHKTRDVFDRYDIVTERDVALATAQLAIYVIQDPDT